MTFGIVKSLIEKNLLESYRNENEFKRTIREFKHNVLSNKAAKNRNEGIRRVLDLNGYLIIEFNAKFGLICVDQFN